MVIEFETVAEWVLGVEAADADRHRVVDGPDTRGVEPGSEALEIVDEEGHMRPPRRSKVLFDPEMERDALTDEPAPTAHRELRRLRDLGQPQQTGIEPADLVLAPGRDRDLDVVDPDDSQRISSVAVRLPRRGVQDSERLRR